MSLSRRPARLEAARTPPTPPLSPAAARERARDGRRGDPEEVAPALREYAATGDRSRLPLVVLARRLKEVCDPGHWWEGAILDATPPDPRVEALTGWIADLVLALDEERRARR